MTMKPIALLLALALAGCHAHRASYVYSGGASEVSNSTGYSAGFSVAGDSPLLAGIIVAVLVAEGIRYYIRHPDGTLAPLSSGRFGDPEPDPSRRISEQDCSRPIVPDGGNLRCK